MNCLNEELKRRVSFYFFEISQKDSGKLQTGLDFWFFSSRKRTEKMNYYNPTFKLSRRQVMKKWLCLFFMVIFAHSILATIPPINGGGLPQKVKEHTEMMQMEYPNGNLAKVIQEWARQKQSLQKISGSTSTYPGTLQYFFPVLVGKYADAGYVQEDAPQELQKELFDGPWPTITMREFYLENSYNQFEIGGMVYGWIQASQPESLYTGPSGSYGMGGYAATFVRELLDSVDADVDFSQFDNDIDGFVETLFIVHSGPGQEYYGKESMRNHIWSHSSRLSYYGGYYSTNDNNSQGIQVKIDNYIIQPAVNLDSSLISIGVFCHEFGHALGLPDLYDTDNSNGASEGIGEWGLMGAGNWNTPKSPSHFCAWSKEILGWLSPVLLEEDIDLQTITPVEINPVAYKLWAEGNIVPYASPYGAQMNVGSQYFLVENRQRIGSDANLNAPGLLIWHVDNPVLNNKDENHKMVDLEEADGLNHLDLEENRGDTGDPFPGSTGNTLFDSTSNPNSWDYDDNDTKVSVSIIAKEFNEVIVDFSVGIIKYEFTQIVLTDDNENGVLEAGEQISLWVELRNNTASSADNVNISVSTASEDLSILDSTSRSFGNIASGDSVNNKSEPFFIEISSQAGENSTHLDISVDMDGGYNKTSQVNFVIGIPELLVVDADISKRSISHFISWLDDNSHPYEVIQSENDSWENHHLLQRDMIAFIGGDNVTALSDTVFQDSLTNWMTGNKSLLIIAPAAGSELDTSDFARDFLHIQYAGLTTSILLKGAPDDPLGMDGGFIFLESRERQMVEAYNGGVLSINFNATNYGGLVRFLDEDQNKIVFSSVDYRHIKDNSPVNEQTVMSAIFDWIGQMTDIFSTEFPTLMEDYLLLQNYPNPFNPRTTIRFFIPNRKLESRLIIYNSLGEKIRIYDLSEVGLGWNEVEWNGKDELGNSVSSGIYYYTIKDNENRISRKMILLK